MTLKSNPDTSKQTAAGKGHRPDAGPVREILGYLNFSSGKPDAGFQRSFNRWQAALGLDRTVADLRNALLNDLRSLQQGSAAFADSQQAEAVIRLALDRCLPAYKQHHADLLFHLHDEDFRQPFLLVRLFEAVLAEGPSWHETERIVQGSLARLNDFLGFRPLPVLEDGRQSEPYPHERFRPVPLYIREAGVAAGPYHDLIERTIDFFRETPDDILQEAHFHPSLMDELALDVRAHDHTHPVNKRTNYVFGEWDPHHLDNQGRYRRFIVRKIILDSLLKWIGRNGTVPREELLYDASAVLCCTMLMASSISGSRPDTHDSNVTLTSLLPKVARQRDTFYTRLLEQSAGSRARRLHREAELTQQAFGHVRQYLNIEVANYGAAQVQHRQLAQLYARMGYSQASREEALVIPSASARFECEISWRITAADQHLDRGEVRAAQKRIREMEDAFHRGIACGALIDPWNILGFQGQFPLFSSREDSIPDHRAEVLLEIMEAIFTVYARALGEAVVQGETALRDELSATFRTLAEEWDRYATGVVEDLPEVPGYEHWESANSVADVLAEWRNAGEAAGDISFWRQHVDRFDSVQSYAHLVKTLLDKGDYVAAMGLLMQWLSQADEVGLESGRHSIYALLLRWMHLVTGTDREARGLRTADRNPQSSNFNPRSANLWPTLRRLFDYLEANAGDYWSLADLDELTGFAALAIDEDIPFDEDRDFEEDAFADEDEESGLFDAAYDNVVFRDSAEDGYLSDTLDGADALLNTEMDLVARLLEPRLKFLHTLAQLWQIAAVALLSQADWPASTASQGKPASETRDVLTSWLHRSRGLQRELAGLMASLWDYEVSPPSGDFDSNVEYDVQLQTKYYLLHAIINTHVNCRTAEQFLLCCLPDHVAASSAGHAAAGAASADPRPTEEGAIVQVYRAVLRRDRSAIRKRLPALLEQLAKRPLLYTPLDGGGHPEQVRAVRTLQRSLRFLLAELPRLGLFRETWHLLRTAYRMERGSRPSGLAVTEFDRLFRTALKHSLQGVMQSSARWRSGRFPDHELIELVSEIVERYLGLWLKHSGSMRLSNLEALNQESAWEDIKSFVISYGGDLLHARMLTLGNLRAILHEGVDRFLESLQAQQDPLHPVKLLDDLEHNVIDRPHAVECLDLVYGCIVDKFERFLEYNTTTTQSDYGEMFYCLLDFLRVEAGYERDAWNLVPVAIAHEVLSEFGKEESARAWEQTVEEKTAEMADRHLAELRRLEQSYGMRLPSITDHLSERFVKPLAVNRMLALVPRTVNESRSGECGTRNAELHTPNSARSFAALRSEIDAYLESTSGSSIDVPLWLHSLEKELDRVESRDVYEGDPADPLINLPSVPIDLREMRRQLKLWNQPLTTKKRKKQ